MFLDTCILMFRDSHVFSSSTHSGFPIVTRFRRLRVEAAFTYSHSTKSTEQWSDVFSRTSSDRFKNLEGVSLHMADDIEYFDIRDLEVIGQHDDVRSNLSIPAIIESFRQLKLKGELTTFTVSKTKDEVAESVRQRFENWGRSRMLDYQGGANY